MSEVLDARLVRRWADAALDALAQCRAEIDALNVYPVPDGDTGTNLFLTWESAQEAAASVSEELPETARMLARGALLGARGNSGVILSQMLHGAAEEMAPPVTVDQLRRVLRRAAQAGYEAVAHPVEGTMLTVMRAAADAVESVEGSMSDVVRAASRAAREALERTPEQLEVLARAGVVDAGGRGVTEVLDALLAVVTGETVSRPVSVRRPEAVVADLPLQGPAFEVMYLLDAKDEDMPTLRAELDALGDSLLVVGGDGLWNVHVHTDEPGAAVEVGVRAGRPHRIRITHFESQRTPSQPHPRSAVAIAAGSELAVLLTECGAQVVSHEEGRRPATRDLLTAITESGSEEVMLLPDDPDSVPVAEAAAAEARAAGIRVAVLPTLSPLQVVSALAVHDRQAPFDVAVVQMAAAAQATRTGAVTTAVREALTSAGVCRPGDVLGLVNRDIAVIGGNVEEVAVEVLDRLLVNGGELVTLMLGADAPEQLVDVLNRHVRQTHPEVDVEVLVGGQPHYPVLVGVE